MSSSNKRFLKIGLTGSMGSGKSTIASVFSNMGIPVYNADKEAKKVYQDPVFKNELLTTFGEKVFDSKGNPDVKKIADVVFSDIIALTTLNNLIHPIVMNDFALWVKKQESPYLILESAILYETGLESFFDFIITVHAQQEVLIKRIQERDNLNLSEIEARLKNQWKSEDKISKADFVLDNNGEKLLFPQILLIHNQLLSFSGKKQGYKQRNNINCFLN